jgi:phosphoribosylanthranilate isomerase
MAMFRVKICGVTEVADGMAVAACAADAIGLNFFRGSSRYVDPARAAEIVAALPAGVRKVGVFVNSAADEIRQTVTALSLDLVQLHGDEPPDFLKSLEGLAIVRAFRLGPLGLAVVGHYLAECRRLGVTPAMVLLDVYAPGVYGGTGQTLDWTQIRAYHEFESPPPLVLAGGLTAENVANAITAAAPAAVDTASGVEVCPGRKDAAKVAAFVAAAQGVFGKNG